MSARFPPWPHFLFALFEPLSCFGGYIFPLMDINKFIVDSTPNVPPPESIHPSSVVLAGQLGNIYAVLGLISFLVLYSADNPKVLRRYVMAYCFSDVNHLYATYRGLGWATFVDPWAWQNVLTWGNVGMTVFMLVNRVLFLLGVFGEARAGERSKKRD
ncbi:hypothetical protein ETB97_005749 [Aspergillus alliaceus]|uniref:DUF7704 domain-containing protein n=1 Tax=Petromyces alliaceus TaxID=209559 RepID=A0A5N7CLY8_PETAA|nr:uncharacterized protein BDW43DRAFT_227241 [Aspergillus alliaceus]KAB8236880.1 hypothetical protein BDW43DRAFT_227241 [Aspergillus alliaceus]KAE8395251.1 hypothetical protein BDV23DRAFT_145453 [Aspergillus alliaceus]KAF5857469.1 hypothetical protein ETB97_005749 [Aspergillus burnettii]